MTRPKEGVAYVNDVNGRMFVKAALSLDATAQRHQREGKMISPEDVELEYAGLQDLEPQEIKQRVTLHWGAVHQPENLSPKEQEILSTVPKEIGPYTIALLQLVKTKKLLDE